MRAYSRSRGFTLLEILVALAIFSVVISVLYGTFFISHKAVRYTDETLLRLHEVRGAMLAMKREFEAALPGQAGDDAIVLRDRDIYGKQTSWVSFNTYSSPLEGAAWVNYYVMEEGGTGRLTMMKKVHHAWNEGDTAREAEAVEDIESFTVEAGSGGSLSQAGWLRTWNGAELPRYIRFTISARVGERTVTLTEVAMPMIGGRL